MYKLKLKDALALMKSKLYILITQEATSMFGDFKGVDKNMKIHALKEAKSELTRQIKLEEKKK